MKKITRDLLVSALTRLGLLAKQEGTELELCIYGGAAMMLAYDYRDITKDIDAICQPSEVVFRLAKQVAEELDLPADWINDDVKCYVAPHEGTRTLPWEVPGISITAPTASYLLAMKALACRRPLPGYDGDIADLRFLIGKLQIATVDEIQEHIDRYYPDDVIALDDTQLLEKLIDEVQDDK
jgi:hypothetical protein